MKIVSKNTGITLFFFVIVLAIGFMLACKENHGERIISKEIVSTEISGLYTGTIEFKDDQANTEFFDLSISVLSKHNYILILKEKSRTPKIDTLNAKVRKDILKIRKRPNLNIQFEDGYVRLSGENRNENWNFTMK